MRPPALVLLNGRAHGGRAEARFVRVRAALEDVCQPRIARLECDGDWEEQIAGAIADGTRFFVAAGGDGTVHALVNALEAARGAVPLHDFCLGAIGLGSSNDFHKPKRREVAGIPVRLDRDGAAARDLVLASWSLDSRLFLVSASVGFTAAANQRFNQGDPVLRWLKRWSTDAAIFWAVLRTLARHHNLPARLEVDGESRAVEISNLSVMKTPWLSGSFRYDTPVEPADGLVAVNLLDGLGRTGLVRALVSLLRGRFLGIAGARHWVARTVALDLDRPTPLELDGELYEASTVRFQLLPEAILACP